MAHVPVPADVTASAGASGEPGRGAGRSPFGGEAEDGVDALAATRDERIALWLPPLGYMVLIFALSSQARVSVPEGVPDAALHVPEFLLLGALLARAFARSSRGGLVGLTRAFLLAAIYGAVDEIHQAFVPGRAASLADVAADVTGAALGVLGFALFARLRTAERSGAARGTPGAALPGAPDGGRDGS